MLKSMLLQRYYKQPRKTLKTFLEITNGWTNKTHNDPIN